MNQTSKRAATRRGAKSTKAGQKTLLDMFNAKLSTSSQSQTETESDAVADSQGTDTCSTNDSDVVEMFEPPSSPLSASPGSLTDGVSEVLEPAGAIMHDTAQKRQATLGQQKLRLKLSGSMTSTRDGDHLGEGRNRDNPIMVDSSPLRPATANENIRLSKPFYPIFAPRKTLLPVSSPLDSSVPRHALPSSGKRLAQKGVAVPYPDSGSQHVRANQSTFCSPSCPLARRSGRALDLSQGCDPRASSPHSKRRPDAPKPEDTAHATLDLPLTHQSQTETNYPTHFTVASSASAETPRACVADCAELECLSSSWDPPLFKRLLDDIPITHRSYPAIQHLFQCMQDQDDHVAAPALTSGTQELWTDKWRPRRADEVLGNEGNALYLRAWLLALRLHIESDPATSQVLNGKDGKTQSKKRDQSNTKSRGTKRPQILRQVDKRKKRRRLDSEEPDDSWIVEDGSDGSDEEHEGDCAQSSGDELAFCQRTYSRLQRVPEEVEGLAVSVSSAEAVREMDKVPNYSQSTPHLGERIHNTILLSGPPGCGKTAAVHACAEELGWDVFEVYPGIGERSGSAMNKLIGDVGKNHLVKQTQRQQKPLLGDGAQSQGPIAFTNNRMTQKAPGRKRVLKRVDSESETNKDLRGKIKPLPSADPVTLPPEHLPISQSIVLVEEVDVLYESDSNFWPSLINIIKDCKRPVVITCNDLSLVPIRDLPLQEILFFSPSPPSLATSYLQCVAFLERRFLERSVVSQLYGYGTRGPCECVSSSATDPPRLPDLRHSLLQLQFGDPVVPTAAFVCEPLRGCDVPESHDDHPVSMDMPQEAVQEDLRIIQNLEKCQNRLSYAECYLLRRTPGDLVDPMTCDTGVANDELGYPILRDEASTTALLSVNQTFYHQDEAIAKMVLSGYSYMCAVPTELHSLAAPEQDLAPQMGPVLKDIQVPLDVLTSTPAMYLDYGPWLRYMVSLDDAAEAVYVKLQSSKDGVRKTRNSLKAVRPVRYVPISEYHRRTLTHTTLSP